MATSPYRMPDPADDEPVVLLERSTRVGRGNKVRRGGLSTRPSASTR